MSEVAKFFAEVQDNLDGLRADAAVRQATLDWVAAIAPHNYTYNFTWLGRPVIQFPQDLTALQEIIWDTRPALIIETGIAHGGSLIFSASMLELNAASITLTTSLEQSERSSASELPQE